MERRNGLMEEWETEGREDGKEEWMGGRIIGDS